jgi:ABC-2 type transport system ATP-binding protein
MSAIVIRDLEKRYGRVVAVDGLNLTVESGELVAFIGPNGAGKSTTLKMLTGQLIPTSGSIELGGIDVLVEPGKAREKMGYVPEEPALYDYLTAREFLEFVVSVRGGGDIDAALEFTQLGVDADRLIREYSQGMKRKTALAAAVVSKPEVLILDEALNGLDPPSAVRVKRYLRTLCDAGTAVVLSTHVLDTAERIADRVVMISNGKIVADVRAEELSGQTLEQVFLDRIGDSNEEGSS